VKEIFQQENKKKKRIYVTTALLTAILLATLIFAFNSAPSLTPSTNPPAPSPIKTFADEIELRNYITVYAQGPMTTYRGSPLDSQFFQEKGLALPEPAPSSATPGGDSATQSESYSTTNIQVSGVDEADIVKNDGKYIYVASNDYTNNQNHVYILKADPQDPRIIAKITLENNTYLAGMFLSQDSNQLIIIGSEYQYYIMDALPSGTEPMIYPYNSEISTFLKVYNISDKVHPILANNFTLSGSYFNSRMIDDYVYAVISQPAYILENNILPLPRVYAETAVSEIEPSKIYYSDTAFYNDVTNNYFTYTTFIGLNLKNSSQELTNMTVLMSGASTMYVSISNIYVTYPSWTEQGEFTSIYRISINKDALNFEAKGSVSGYVLNQYSMDEYNGNFRLATTSQKQESSNNVYVLNMNLITIGKLENLAITERIYSARFMGNQAYLVTFRQTDPFFVLDLSNPAEPKVAGELKIPGYSSYLHPYDENYVIGLGIENNNLKLSLFNVTKVNAPTEIAKYTIQGDYTQSDALYEPKAFLFNKEKQLLVIPVSITQYGVVPQSSTEPTDKEIGIAPTQGGYWQGAYVFKITLSGFELQGGVTHQENTNQQYYYGDYNQNVNRALYVGNTLYTISNAKVKLNNLIDLAQIAEIQLN
jgi:inhibitor of cysteine peptidase